MKKWKALMIALATLMSLGFINENAFATFDKSIVDKLDADKFQLLIKAVNPGYTIDDVKNTGEFIELVNTSEHSLSLTGLVIRYTSSSGSVSSVYDFPDGTTLTGESLLMRFSKEEKVDDADMTYYFNSGNGLAAGGANIELILKSETDEKTLDEVCWKSYTGCENKTFSSSNKTTLVRDMATKEWTHVAIDDYTPDYVKGRKNIVFPEKQEEEKPDPKCKGLVFSEIFTFYENSKLEQYVELYNSTSDQIDMKGCAVRYKNKEYELSGVVKANEYYAYYPGEKFSFTKNPTTKNEVELLDADATVLDTLVYYNGQKKGVAYALVGYDNSGKETWAQTYVLTPGKENEYQKYKSCEDGKVLNETTGNCVKASSVDTGIAPCPEGQYRNPLTNRCKKYETTTSATLKTCAVGYERNPETNRCRKIVNNDGADYALEAQEYEEKSSFVAIWAIVIVAAVGCGYVVWQYRDEIKRFVGKD